MMGGGSKMKQRILGSFFCKTAAVLLCVVSMALLIGAGTAVGMMIDDGWYTTDQTTVQNKHYHSAILSAAYFPVRAYHRGTSGVGFFTDNYANLRYDLYDGEGTLLRGNYGGEAIRYVESVAYQILPGGVNLIEVEQGSGNPVDYVIVCYVPEQMDAYDDIRQMDRLIDAGFRWKVGLPLLGAAALLVNLSLFLFLLCAVGHAAGSSEVAARNPFDKIPLDLYTLLYGLIGLLLYLLARNFRFYRSVADYAFLFLMGTLGYFLLLFYAMGFALRCKLGGILKQTLLWRLLCGIGRGLRWLGRKAAALFGALPVIWKTAVAICFLFLFDFFVICCRSLHVIGWIWFLHWLLLLAFGCWISLCLTRLKKAGEAMARGDTDYEIDFSGMPKDFRAHGENLGKIRENIRKSVEDQLRSERLKTELITNVSHDLKTPLTSIVNYVDLMKKEPIENEKLRSYLEVLDRQSARLRKLTVDLVEASKASTGNLRCDPVPCVLNELLTQCCGEYTEKLEAAGLQLRKGEMPQLLTVYADGRHLWRIFDNLLSNVCKYAQPGTRVYLTLEEQENQAVITLRNISRFPLTTPGDELMQRFVRGDASRHSEGSGLGLSIASSLTELQNGRMQVLTDGDLFKVILTFPLMTDASFSQNS